MTALSGNSAAAGKGTEIEIVTDGEDAQGALEGLIELVQRRFGENE